MHDALEFERMGIPATTVITDPFQSLFTVNATRYGFPGYHSVMVPHPISIKDDEQLDKMAARISDLVFKQLTNESQG
ncbi:hypothetical protein ACFL9T_20315 [Thermodesulfobacteriota bacterium]